MKKIFLLLPITTIISFFFVTIIPSKIFASYQEAEKIKAFGPVGQDSSQYSPWVMHETGWGSYIMYYCKNTPINNVWRDRVWRIESWTGGKTDWISDQIVIEGTLNQDDDLSCSPGIVIAPDGTWHMYYVTANRTSDAKLYLYHATAQGPGITWAKQGQIAGEFPRPYPGYMETPSPIFINGKLVIFFVGEGGFLYKTEALDNSYHNFSSPVKLNSPSFAQAGRVTYKDGGYYYAYSKNPTDNYQFSTHIYLSISQDGLNFSEGSLLSQANGSGWDSTYMWSPHLLKENNQFLVYYAGNTGKPCTDCWTGAATSVGLRSFNISILTCNYPWADVPPVSHTISKENEEIKVNLGFSEKFGGIGVKFELINKSNPNPVDILEARSGAGAGWQFTSMISGYNNDGFLANQASGNSNGYQWGYSNNLFTTEINGTTVLTSNNWAPNPTDVLSGTGTQPCPGEPNQSVVFDDGHPRIEAKQLTISEGDAIDILSSYSLKSRIDQSWKTSVPVEALYLSRNVAKMGDLRVYLIGNNGWMEGPIRPYEIFSITHGYRDGTSTWPLDQVYHWQINPDLKYVLFVWNIFGRDIGILVKDIKFGATLRMDNSVYCTNKNDYKCGSIDFIFNDGISQNVNFTKNSIRTYSYHYLVGTIPQLEAAAGRTLVSREGDFNDDGNVNIFDLRHFLTKFLNPYTIFDYNKLVENFGK